MCNNTKQRIADAVEELICTQPGGKITVQQIMELTQMNRQSFYYHYQDIFDVLQRIIDRKFCRPLAFDPREDTRTWCRRALTLLRENRVLAQRISRELGNERVYALVMPTVWPQADRLIPLRPGQDPAQRKMAVDAICHCVLCSVSELIAQGQSFDVEKTLESLGAVFAVLGVPAEG